MVIVSSDDDIDKCYMSRIRKRIDLKCLSDAKCILGMQVEQESGKLDNEIYMKAPDGYEYGENTVCRLKKSIYGLKQAGMCWNEYFTGVMLKSGMCQSMENPCIRVKDKSSCIAEYMVDDMVIASSDDDIEKCRKKD